jgi:hypothetical protein
MIKLNLISLIIIVILSSSYSQINVTLPNYTVLASTTITSASSSIIKGNVGLYPGSIITGFPSGSIIGVTDIATTPALNGQGVLTTLYNYLAGLACGTSLTGQDLGGKTLAPGVYCFTSSASNSGVLTLDAQNSATAYWVFQVVSSIDFAGSSSIIIINSPTPKTCSIYWQIGSSATISTLVSFKGTICALASISVSTNAEITGNLYASTGAITFQNNVVTQCSPPICYGKNSTDPTVCNSQGICSSPNNCVCNSNYTGIQCTIPNCYGKNASDPTVCNSQGVCSSPNNCVCNNGYSGTQCYPVCFGRNSIDPTVCNSQGVCSSPNNCVCNSNFVGNNCTIPVCSGKNASDPTVCSSQGNCSSPNNCVCNIGYVGNNCQTFFTIQNAIFPNYTLLASSTITSASSSIINGNVGLYPGTSITGFPLGSITGSQHIGTTQASNGQLLLTNLYNNIAGLRCDTALSGQDLGGKTLNSGVYCFTATALNSGVLTLDAQNLATAYWVFQVGSSLNFALGSSINIINSVSSTTKCKIYWQVGSSTTISTSASFSGIMCSYSSVSVLTDATISGNLYASNGAITLQNNAVSGCSVSTCFGKNSLDPTVCSGKGVCLTTDNCVCRANYTGTQCSNSMTNNSKIDSKLNFVALLILIIFQIIN